MLCFLFHSLLQDERERVVPTVERQRPLCGEGIKMAIQSAMLAAFTINFTT